MNTENPKYMTDDVKLSNQLYLDFSSGDRASWLTLAIQDKQSKINAWSEEVAKALESKGQMAVPHNEILPAIDLIIAELTENDPRFSAVGVEKSDNKVASYVADLFSWIWDKSKGRVRIERFIRDFVEIGLSAIYVYIDPYADNGKGEIKFTTLNPLTELFIDPDTTEADCSDAPHLIIRKVLPETIIKDNYPDFDLTDCTMAAAETISTHNTRKQGQVLVSTKRTDIKYYELIDRYTKVKVPRYHVIDPYSNFEDVFEDKKAFEEWGKEDAFIMVKFGNQHIITDKLQVQELMGVLKAYGSIYHLVNPPSPDGSQQEPQIVSGIEGSSPYDIPGSTVQLHLTNKMDLVKLELIKLDTPKVDRIQRVFQIGNIEFANEIIPNLRDHCIITAMLHHDGTPFPMGDIRLVVPLQNQIDKTHNLMMTYYSNITNLKILVQKGSGQKKELEEALSRAGTEVLEVDYEVGAQPIFINYPPLPAGIMQTIQSLEQKIQQIIGAFQSQDGQPIAAPRTFGGTMHMDEMMQRRAMAKKRKIESSLDQIAKVVSQLIPVTYTERKEIRITQPNHSKSKSIVFNDPQMEDDQIHLINDVINMEYDVKVISGSMLPTNKMQQLQLLEDAYQMGVIHDPSPIIELLPIANADELADKEDALKQSQQMVEQMQKSIKDLQGLIQTLQRENIQKEIKVKVAKVGVELEKIVVDAQAFTMLGKMRVADHVKKIKEENKKIEQGDFSD